MQETTYYVILFRRQDGELIGTAPMKAESETAAVGQAQFLAQEVAGAVVIGRLTDGADATADAFEILFKTGEVPEDLSDLSDLWTV
jgi:hypothetical protein